MRKEKTGLKLKIVMALVLAASLLCAPVVKVDAWITYKTKATTKKTDAKKKEASVYDVKSNSVDIKLDGYKNKQDIAISFYEKQENGKYKIIKTTKKKDVKDDTFKFKQTLNEKSDFDYGKTYKYKITSKEYFVEQKNLSEYLNSDYNGTLANNKFLKTSNEKLSDGDKVNFKNCGKLLTFKHKNSKETKTFKTITKNKRLLEFSKRYKKYTYSQAKRHQKGFADCSSFVYACYKDIGMNLGGDGANTETELRWCEQNALKVKLGSAKLGDIIFYSDEDVDTFEDHYKHVTHVAMFKDNKTIMEMSGDGVDFRTRTVSARDHDCIAVYRPIYDSKDMVDKDHHKQNLKESKKEKEEKYLKKLRKKKKQSEKDEKSKKNKKTPAKKKEEETSGMIAIEQETDANSSW
ncbi:MAG: C40 family peptidase [Eubacterium sp.]|nr:C40 family peptidase [Eubacterium sp.]